MKDFPHAKPLIGDFHPSPFFCSNVARTNPIEEKRKIAEPARKGVKPVPGLTNVPSPYLREAMQIDAPQMSQIAELA